MKNRTLVGKPIEKKRNPNIDFIRIIGMLAIIIVHMLQHGNAYAKYKRYKELRYLNIICKWHVSSFGIISGMVGNQSHKFSNLLYLWFTTIFYMLITGLMYNRQNLLKNQQIFFRHIFPVIYGQYWYFSAYFGIYPFLPFINTSISVLPQIMVKKSIYFMIGIFIIWASYYNDVFSQNSGYSPFSLLIFYIFGAYIGKYIFFKRYGIINKFLICSFCFIIFVTISLASYNIGIKNCYPNINQRLKKIFETKINSFPILLEVFSIIIFVSQIKFNNFISRFISFIGYLTFDVYLIHENPYIRTHYIGKYISKQSDNLNLSAVFFMIIKGCLYIFIICIFISFIRNKIFILLKIKNICIYCESFITKIIYYLI